jgi:hypothetical protein
MKKLGMEKLAIECKNWPWKMSNQGRNLVWKNLSLNMKTS